MRYKIILLLIVLILFPVFTLAQNTSICSPKGYSIFTVNGIFTDEKGARDNKRSLEDKLTDTYNNQPLKVDFLYNQTHLLGVGDAVDAVAQGLFDQKSDYDLTEILNDASQKVTTQKLLLVGHSQGNFYANNFYDKVASQSGGIPSQSIGVYGVATPANRVAGEGKYLTSDTDNVIASVVGRVIKILPPNIHIPLQSSDGNGHSFSNVYLKYQSDKIISDIKSSLDKLKENDEQDPQEPCISAPELTTFHKAQGALLTSADFVINNTKNAVVYIANAISDVSLAIGNMFKGLSASVVESLPDASSVTTILPGISESIKNNSLQEQTPTTTDKATLEEKDIVVSEPVVVSDTSNKKENTKNDNSIANISSIAFHGSNNHVSIAKADSNSISEENIPVSTPPVLPPVVPPVTDPVVTNPPITEPVITEPATADATAPVIKIIGNTFEVITKDSTYTDAGATASDTVDGVRTVNTSGTVDPTKIGDYIVTYTSSDNAGNISTTTRTVRVATYKYISKYSFGAKNGDDHDWQVWSFNGSNVYDWSDTYVDNYLREQFKIQAYPGGFWCSQCLQRGVFNHDPQKGFESTDIIYLSGLDGNPQNNMNGVIYDVAIQWDSAGYTYTVSHNSVIDTTGRIDVPNMNQDSWTSWDGSFNSFQMFPAGNWQGVVYGSPLNRTGGGSMILQPFPIYKTEPVSVIPTLSFPNKGLYAGNGISPTRGRTNLTPFNFQVIYTDKNNNAPQNVKLHVANKTTGVSLSEVEMQKISQGADILSDGSFANGELYITNNILYDTGDYNYYFTANDSTGNLIRIPENDMLNFGVIPSTYMYIPKYSFGTNNGDGRDWQVWSFNGSNVYNWSDTYVNNYLKEQFKLQTYPGGFWCSQCLQRGIFNHDPQKGFESADVILSSLENNPQNSMNGVTYDVMFQWDSTGYVYTISHDGITDATGHTDISNVNENLWTSWDGSFNNFQTFPSGNWQGASTWFPIGYTGGGGSMMLKPYPVYLYSAPVIPVLSNKKEITAFNFTNLTPNVVGVTDEANHTVSLNVPFNTDITTLVPAITVSGNASINPNNNIVQNFTNPITYTVTAEDGSTQNYIVTVTIAANPNIPPVPDPTPDTTPPSILSYTFNGIAENITINPLTNPLSLVLSASENVNWMSIKFEKQDDDKVYKTYQSGANCVDGTNTCTKTWDGLLTKGGLLESQNGIYRIKIHMKDNANNEYYDYLSPYLITVNTN